MGQEAVARPPLNSSSARTPCAHNWTPAVTTDLSLMFNYSAATTAAGPVAMGLPSSGVRSRGDRALHAVLATGDQTAPPGARCVRLRFDDARHLR